MLEMCTHLIAGTLGASKKVPKHTIMHTPIHSIIFNLLNSTSTLDVHKCFKNPSVLDRRKNFWQPSHSFETVKAPKAVYITEHHYSTSRNVVGKKEHKVQSLDY